jgi:hypothetical protein
MIIKKSYEIKEIYDSESNFSKSWQNNQRFKKVALPYGVKIVLRYKIKWKALQQGWFYFLKANRIFLSCRQQLNNSGETAGMNFPQ